MLRKSLSAVIAGLLTVATVAGTTPTMASAAAKAANTAVTVIVDGKNVNCSPAPIAENGRVLVPLKSVFEALGYSVEWDNQYKLAKARMTADDGSKRNVSLSVTKMSMAVWEIRTTVNPVTGLNDRIEFIIPLDPQTAPIKNVNDHLLLPIGTIAAALGCDVKWDNATKTATINTAGAKITPPTNWFDAIEKHYAKYAPDQLTAKQSWLDKDAENQRILSGAVNAQVQSGAANANGGEQKPADQQRSKKCTMFSKGLNRSIEYVYKAPAKPPAAPVVGSVPANILVDESVKTTSYPDPLNEGYWIQNLTKPYLLGYGAVVGGCNWYAGGRFNEVYGVPFLCFDQFRTSETYLDAADKYDEFIAIQDIYDVRDNSIVVYGKGKYNSGHVAFVEYVERDSSGKPVNVYFTEANNNGSGDYRHGIDGAVQKLSIADFLNRSKPTIGYIVPNPDFYKN